MARRLTIRTKLMAGLGLVLAISAVLTANTLIGLYSYRNSIRAFEAKTREIPLGGELWDRVAQLDRPEQSNRFDSPGDAEDHFDARVARVDKALYDYRSRVNRTMRSGRDPDAGRTELPTLADIDHELAKLRALPPFPYWADDDRWLLDQAVGGERLLNRRLFQQYVAELRRLVGRLPIPTYHDMCALADEARSTYTANLWIAYTTSGLGLAMLLVLVRQSYRWIFRPIRQLHTSVQRVGGGELEHRIELPTGDEMQELAEAFNAMTGRLAAICRDLERQVEERSQQLVRSEQLASVGFLAAGVAHEINNPLQSITLGSDVLGRRLKTLVTATGRDADDVWRCLAMIQSEAFRCKGITEKLLDFSRLREHERQPCRLTDLVADVIDIVQHMGRYREKQIVLAGSSEVIAEVNPPELKQVVLNLVVNALDSMDAGGSLTIDVREQPGHAVIEFADTGCGMTPDVLKNIFQPFFTRSRIGRGTGLGLSISHRIIADHGGTIDVASDGPGLGSRFTVRLPLERSNIRVLEGQHRVAA